MQKVNTHANPFLQVTYVIHEIFIGSVTQLLR